MISWPAGADHEKGNPAWANVMLELQWSNSMTRLCVYGETGNALGQPTRKGSSDGLCAVRAALGGGRNVAEALGTGFGGRRGGGYRFLELIQQRIQGENDQKIYRGRDQQERDERVEEVAILDLSAVDIKDQRGEVRLVDDGRDQRGNDVGHQRSDNGAESSADYDGYGEVDDIAAKDEVSKAF
jgi:hypothetical protein